jgi:acyl carrier protein
MNHISEKVFKVFQSVLSLDDDVVKESLVYNQYPAWDSVAHMGLVAALEEAFDCMLDMQDILDMGSFEKSVQIMSRYAKGN